MTATSPPPFHLAIPVDDIAAARDFYGGTLGFAEGRSDTQWVDWNFEGHQVVTHRVAPDPVLTEGAGDGPRPARDGVAGTNPVDGHQVPVPHFGLVLPVARFQQLAGRLRAAGTEFVIDPYVRFEGEPGEQWTMFFLDPAGNALEFKAFRDIEQLFAK